MLHGSEMWIMKRKKQNSVATSRDENDQMEVWIKIKGQLVLYGIKAEIKNRERTADVVH